MRETFQVQNVKCGGCAATLKTKLREQFGEIEVNLEVEPREITLELKDENRDELRVALRALGYPLSDDKLSTFEATGAKAKSYVSCAIGKFEAR